MAATTHHGPCTLNEIASDINLIGLFISAFVSSTLLPGGSEIALVYLAQQGEDPPLLLWLAATSGNTLGGLTSWALGWWINRRYPWRKLDDAKHQRALERVRRWGSPVLLLSWLPVIGDPLCLVAGWLRIGLLQAALFIALGKGARYAVLLALTPT